MSVIAPIPVSLVAASSDADATSYTTASFTTKAGTSVLVGLMLIRSGAAPTIPTLTRDGVTYAQVTDGTTVAEIAVDANRTITWFVGTHAGAVSATLLIDHGATTHHGCGWLISEAPDTDPADIAVQVDVNTVTGTSLAAALATFDRRLANPTFVLVGKSSTGLFTPTAPLTALNQIGTTSPGSRLASGWANSERTAPAYSWSGSTTAAIIAIEIRAEAHATRPVAVNMAPPYHPGSPATSFTVPSHTVYGGHQVLFVVVVASETVAPTAVAGHGVTDPELFLSDARNGKTWRVYGWDQASDSTDDIVVDLSGSASAAFFVVQWSGTDSGFGAGDSANDTNVDTLTVPASAALAENAARWGMFDWDTDAIDPTNHHGSVVFLDYGEHVIFQASHTDADQQITLDGTTDIVGFSLDIVATPASPFFPRVLGIV